MPSFTRVEKHKNSYRNNHIFRTTFCLFLTVIMIITTAGGEMPANGADPEQVNRSNNWYVNATHHEKLQEYEKAIFCLQKALEIHPGNEQARNLLTRLQTGGDPEDSLQVDSPQGSGQSGDTALSGRELAIKKACVANMKVISCGLEMFDLDSMEAEPVPTGEMSPESELMKTLIGEKYIQDLPVCRSGGSYVHEGDFQVSCTVHGRLPGGGGDDFDEFDVGGNGVVDFPPAPGSSGEAGAADLTPQEALKKVGKLIRDGQFRDALPFARAAAEGMPDSAQAMSVMGYVNEKLGILDESIRCYQKAMEKEPGNPSYANNFAFACANAGILLTKAVEKAREAVTKKPNSEHFRDTLGFCLLKSKDYAGAAKEFRKAQDLAPEFLLPTYHLSFIDTAEGRVEDALVKLAQVIKEDSANIPALIRTGIIRFETDSIQESVEAFKKVLELNPEHTLSMFYLGFILMAAENPQAADFFKAITTINPSSTEGYLAQSYLAQGTGTDSATVVSHFRSAIDARPGWGFPNYLLAGYYFLQNSYDEALTEARAALRTADPHLQSKIQAFVDKVETAEEQNVMNWYENHEWGYKFVLPGSDWEATEDTEQYMVKEAQVVLVKQDESSGRFALVAVIMQPNPNLYTSDDVAVAWEEELQRVVPGYKKLDTEKVEVGEYEGKVLVYEQENARVTKHAFISYGDSLLTIVVTDNKEYFEESIKVYSRILKTFQFM